ncbi:putative transcriptional regulator, ArsR family [Kribbella flavida DSM 17836]|uniref:Putative transcriptional regulator, ArsR family n=1 Tax=Kribbella flavida (strain DSM 17836 / JCM 10339 / NBRC 14399) TaxID=479435 RepID=D2PM40_KRIFD|nr:winged helix-turn-helix domain-containing protein [Kribbella flavida]ADB34408.1 putative transcriptional regulator, ArsR family [Kribbella flavida DSM 17836]
MLRIHFTPRDLAKVTIATRPAPLWEVLLSLHMLQHSDGRLVFEDWRRHVRTTVAPDQMRLLLELTPPRGYSPDFLTPADCPADFESALELALSTPRQQVRSQLDLLSHYRPVSPWTRELAEGERSSMRKLGHAIRTYHDAAIAPYWKSIGTHVSADRAHRGEALSRHGVDRLLSSLHPRVRWVAPVLQVLDMTDRDLYLDGRGIELQPSAFCWQVPTKLQDPELKPILVYPIQHAPGILRQSSTEASAPSNPLGALLGSTRAAALEAAVEGCTTTELAKRCNISPAAASHQATVLREAGLITTRRDGASVRHEITQLGIWLLSGHGSGGLRRETLPAVAN